MAESALCLSLAQEQKGDKPTDCTQSGQPVKRGKKINANVYVEAGPKGRSEGDPIDDYVVEHRADHVLATFKTQHEAIEWSRRHRRAPLVA
jgi:hypothetical protein